MLGLALKGIQISLFLGALALTWMAVSPFARSQTPGVYVPPPVDGALGAPASVADYASIARRNLFAVPEAPPEVAPEPQEEIVETRLNARLLGTVVAGNSREGQLVSSAIVRDTNGEVQTVGIDDPLAGGAAKVVSIESRRIVIEHQGRREAVVLDEDAAPASDRAHPAGPKRQRGPGIEALRQAQMSSNAEMLGIMRSMSQLGRFAADRDEEGRLNGIRVTRINDGSPLSDLGVSIGDRVSAINGVPLGGETPALGAIASLADGSDPVLTIEDASGRQREIVLPRSVLDAGFGGN